MAVNWISVDSSAISHVAYEGGEIYVVWKHEGGSYVYAYRASEDVFNALMAADSIGQYANRVVKKYPSRPVR